MSDGVELFSSDGVENVVEVWVGAVVSPTLVVDPGIIGIDTRTHPVMYPAELPLDTDSTSVTAADTPGRPARLTVDDWVRTALEVLVRDGVAAVKISRLCEELHVTKGSFYWHFHDINGLMEAVANAWCDSQDESMNHITDLEAMPPRERLEALATSLTSQRVVSVEVAVRDWARSNATVADAVRRLDRLVFSVVRTALTELGFDDSEAGVRAGALVFAGIGFLHGHTSLDTPTADEIGSLVRLLTATPHAAP